MLESESGGKSHVDFCPERLDMVRAIVELMLAVERGRIGLLFRGIAVMTSNLWLRVVL